MSACICGVAPILLVSSMALALALGHGPRHKMPKVDCTAVRELVEKMGEDVAERVAREAGMMETQLRRAKACLK